VVILILIGGIWLSAEFVFRKKNETAERRIIEIASLLDKYYQKNGHYPQNLNALPHYNKNKAKLFGILTIPEIRYKKKSKGYQLFYYEAPFGPFYGYDSVKKEWYYEE